MSITEILAKHDPIGLIAAGCSEHEYDIAADMIQPIAHYHEDALTEYIYRIFKRQFGAASAKLGAWREIAKDIKMETR